jgi:hypothetical protein
MLHWWYHRSLVGSWVLEINRKDYGFQLLIHNPIRSIHLSGDPSTDTPLKILVCNPQKYSNMGECFKAESSAKRFLLYPDNQKD